MALAAPKPKADWETYQYRYDEYPKHINTEVTETVYDPATKQTNRVTKIKARTVHSEAEEEQVTGKPVVRKPTPLPPGAQPPPSPPSLELVMSRGYDRKKAETIVAEEQRAFEAGEKPYGDKERSVLQPSENESKDGEKPLELPKGAWKQPKNEQK